MRPLDEDDRDALEKGDLALRLWKNVDVQALLSIQEAQASLRIEALLTSASQRPEGTPTDEFLKGAIFGLRMTRTSLQHMMADSAAVRQKMQDEGDLDDDRE